MSLAVLTFFDWRASIIASVAAIVAVFILVQFDVTVQKKYKKVFKAENFVATAVHDYISNVMTVISLCLKSRVLHVIDDRGTKGLTPHLEGTTINEWKWFVTNFIISIMTVAVIGLYAYRSYMASGTIVMGTLFILYQYLHTVGVTFYNFAYFYGEMVKRSSAVHAAKVIDDDYDALPHKNIVSLPLSWKSLLIQDLSFSYKDMQIENATDKNTTESTARMHVNNVTFILHRGQKIAFIGESGSGKSTALALLRGLYEADVARVLCDNQELADGLKHLSDVTTLIPQDPEIFNATVVENVTMGLKSDDEVVHRMMNLARFDVVLPRLANGIETNVMEKGVSLSGGEKQRLALARGLFVGLESDILLLDEPTSSVDSANEIVIYEGIFKEFAEKTIVSSIHRLHLFFP